MRLGRTLSSTVALAMALGWAGAALAQTEPQPTPQAEPQPAPSGGAQTPGQPSPDTTSNTAETAGATIEGQVEESVGLAEIVVTAQRRAESVQDVPIAVSAFSAAELEGRNITETLDLVQYVPNLVGQNNTGLGSANVYYLRGLGNTESIATFDPPVGTYVDEIYLSRQNANNFSFFDVERVEVLRGPQGTLFGRNTTGGAVNVILKKPGDEIAGYIEGGYGRYDRKLLRGSIDIPYSEGIQVKLSGYYSDSDGYVKNVTTGEKLNEDDASGLRGALRLNITDNITWDMSVARMVSEQANILNFECNPANPSDCNGRFSTTGLRKNFPENQSQFVGLLSGGRPATISGEKANYALGNKTAMTLVTSNFQIAGENHTLNVITGWVDLSQKFNLDFADGRGLPGFSTTTGVLNAIPAVRGLPQGGFNITNDGTHEQFTQEVKLTGKLFDSFIEYVAGGYLLDEDNQTDFADTLGLSPTATLLLADRTLFNKTEAWAGYAQVDANVTDQLKLTAGIRYTDEEKTLGVADNRPLGLTPNPALRLDTANVAAAGIPTKLDTKLWTPRFAVNYTPNDDILLFASATRGFKSGGWNARSTTPATVLPFGAEKVWNYEAGIKSEWLDKRLRVNLTGFYMDVADFQVNSAFNNAGVIGFITRNFGDLRNYGAELEVQAVPVDNLNLYANVGLQNAKYKNIGAETLDQQARCLSAIAAGNLLLRNSLCGVGVVTYEGDISKPVRAPDVTISAGASYNWELEAAGIAITPSVNASWTGEQEVGVSNLSFYRAADGSFNATGNGELVAGSLSKSYLLINASIAVTTLDDAWRLSVECDNCLSETYTQSTLANYTYINPPMSWFVRLRRKF